jgi:hypothetical protein
MRHASVSRRARLEISSLILALALSIFALPSHAQAQVAAPPPRVVLPIPPIPQQTTEWCWAASAEMVLEYYRMPALNRTDYQCGIVAFAFQRIPACLANCFNCPIPAGQFDNLAVVMQQYGAFARAFGVQAPNVHGSVANSALPGPVLIDSIATGSPVMAGISPNGFTNPQLEPQHAVVIVGYDRTQQTIIVNDPWPLYDPAGLLLAGYNVDPYLQRGARKIINGQYEIPYNAFVGMLWDRSIHHLHTSFP